MTRRARFLLLLPVAALAACSSSPGGSPASSGAASTSPTARTSVPSVSVAPPSSHRNTPTSSVHPSRTASTPVTTPTATRTVVAKPVTAAGDLAPGWSASKQPLTIDCSAGTRSPVAEGDGVLYCQPSAATAVACWRAHAARAAYCLIDPRSHTVVRYALAGAFPKAGPSELEPQPLALDLADGTRCALRDSGAAGRLQSHPDWVPYYYCGTGSDQAVWAAPNSVTSGITHGDGPWTVQLAPSDGATAPRTELVSTVYLVATA